MSDKLDKMKNSKNGPLASVLITNYNKSKFLSSKHLVKLHSKNNFPFTVLRLYQAYGERQDINRPAADNTPACGGTTTRVTPSSSATRAACKGPAPPKGTMA